MHWLKMKEAVEVYAYLRQFDLSADRVLQDRWEKILRYYSDRERVLGLSCARDLIKKRMGDADKPHLENLSVRNLLGIKRRLGMILRQAASIATRRVFLTDTEIYLIYLALDRAIRLLSTKIRPESRKIIEVRLRAYDAHCLLSMVAFSLGFRRAECIERFNGAPHVKYLTIQEVLKVNE